MKGREDWRWLRRQQHVFLRKNSKFLSKFVISQEVLDPPGGDRVLWRAKGIELLTPGGLLRRNWELEIFLFFPYLLYMCAKEVEKKRNGKKEGGSGHR